MQDEVKVTPEDRSAAWPHRATCYFERDRHKWDDGVYDKCDLIQAFAKHRTAAEEGLREAAERAPQILERNLHRQTEKCDDAITILRAALRGGERHG